jgi:hypothetical protein
VRASVTKCAWPEFGGRNSWGVNHKFICLLIECSSGLDASDECAVTQFSLAIGAQYLSRIGQRDPVSCLLWACLKLQEWKKQECVDAERACVSQTPCMSTVQEDWVHVLEALLHANLSGSEAIGEALIMISILKSSRKLRHVRTSHGRLDPLEGLVVDDDSIVAMKELEVRKQEGSISLPAVNGSSELLRFEGSLIPSQMHHESLTSERYILVTGLHSCTSVMLLLVSTISGVYLGVRCHCDSGGCYCCYRFCYRFWKSASELLLKYAETL